MRVARRVTRTEVVRAMWGNTVTDFLPVPVPMQNVQVHRSLRRRTVFAFLGENEEHCATEDGHAVARIARSNTEFLDEQFGTALMWVARRHGRQC